MFLTFGEVMARIAPEGHCRWQQSVPGRVQVTWGGGEANVAASLALYGLPVKYLTALPSQPIARELANSLRGLGVDVSPILWREEGRLGLYFVEVGANQRGSTVIYDRDFSAVSLAGPEEYDFELALENVHWLHVTGITPAVSRQSFETNLALLKRAKEREVTISCDLNYRKKLWNWDPGLSTNELARKCMAEVMPLIDVVIGNEADASDVLDIHPKGTDVEQGQLNIDGYVSVAQQIVERYSNVSHVAITLRESISADHNNWGGMLYESNSKTAVFAPLDAQGTYSPYAITDIVDRVGAGDSFAGGLLYGLNSDPYRSDLASVIGFAVAASCLKHTIPGDFNYVNVAEVEALRAGNTSGRVQR